MTCTCGVCVDFESAPMLEPTSTERREARKQRTARIRSLMEDSGYSRREATALVDEGMDVL